MAQTLHSANPAEKSGSDLDGAADTARHMEHVVHSTRKAAFSERIVWTYMEQLATINDCVPQRWPTG